MGMVNLKTYLESSSAPTVQLLRLLGSAETEAGLGERAGWSQAHYDGSAKNEEGSRRW